MNDQRCEHAICVRVGGEWICAHCGATVADEPGDNENDGAPGF